MLGRKGKEEKMSKPDILIEEYNKIPYQSFPYWQSHPAHLYTLAKLFKLNPKPIEKARILELGCAAGGNLIPVAFHYPNTECIGIDISDVEIDLGLKIVNDLNIKNITLKKQSILDFSEKEKSFDYILCHGVYSWVDLDVQKKIMAIIQKHLDKNGIAYISYNTLPGWNMVMSVRDLMRWHTKNIPDPSQKAKQARIVLQFIVEGLKDNLSPYARFLQEEINMLSKHADSYLLHDHLSSFNNPIYFHQFMEQATTHRLSYLSDALLETMYSENLAPPFAQELRKINDIIANGQYMDFIRNQRFRCSLLCHQNQKIYRNLATQDIEQFDLQLKGVHQDKKLNDQAFQTEKEMVFINNNISLKVKNPISKAAMLILDKERHKPMSYKTLCEKVSKASNTPNLDTVKNILNNDLNLMRATLAGFFLLSSDNIPHYTLEIKEKPTACPLARYQAQKQNTITNRRHQVTPLSPVGKILLPLLDGTNTIDALTQQLRSHIEAHKLTVLDHNKNPITQPEKLPSYLVKMVENELHIFSMQALLI